MYVDSFVRVDNFAHACCMFLFRLKETVLHLYKNVRFKKKKKKEKKSGEGARKEEREIEQMSVRMSVCRKME